ncbi:hypothetical protein [Nocardia cyriacigeorgica]|uniref:hypothetical protein n=1 Tax=Nocardia cyriacigeorgica TaxID=135487 RepID=UPI002458C998|nr:hypothetical protein [Nocardia cyriacigeorgica]
MSKGQRPRRREYFPHMKRRGRGRQYRRRVHVVLWQHDPVTGRLYAPWPQTMKAPSGATVDIEEGTFTVETGGCKRTLNRWSGRWQAVGTTDDGGVVLFRDTRPEEV